MIMIYNIVNMISFYYIFDVIDIKKIYLLRNVYVVQVENILENYFNRCCCCSVIETDLHSTSKFCI